MPLVIYIYTSVYRHAYIWSFKLCFGLYGDKSEYKILEKFSGNLGGDLNWNKMI